MQLLDTSSTSMILCCVYRSPSTKPNNFLNLLEKTLNLLYQQTALLIICGDLNINSLIENSEKQNLEIIMTTFNLTQVVTFPTRICNNEGTLIDNIFLDKAKLNNITVNALDNGLSDHIAQISQQYCFLLFRITMVWLERFREENNLVYIFC